MHKFIPVLFLVASIGAAPLTDSVVLAAGNEGGITSVDKAGKKHSTKGYVPMKAAPTAKPFKASANVASANLPRKVDLRKSMTPVENQGDTSSCVANALAGSYEYWVKRSQNTDLDVSRMFIYFNARWRSGDQNKDEGSVIQLAMEGLQEFGACRETEWPFDKPLLFKKPNRTAYTEASKTKIKEMQLVPTELKAWKEALASGLPIVFGCLLFDSFDQCNKNGGVVPMPSPADLGRAEHGGHAMCAVGYSDKEEVFIVRNSWGDQWGDKGYCYMPYNYLMNPKFNGGDSWVFIPEVPIENVEDTWVEDDAPVTDDGRGVTYEIVTYPVEAYETVEITWWVEETEEYDETAEPEYTQYVEYSEESDWEEMEDFTTESVITEWTEEHPGEDIDLDEEDEAEEADDDSDTTTEHADDDTADDESAPVQDDADDDGSATDDPAMEDDASEHDDEPDGAPEADADDADSTDEAEQEDDSADQGEEAPEESSNEEESSGEADDAGEDQSEEAPAESDDGGSEE